MPRLLACSAVLGAALLLTTCRDATGPTSHADPVVRVSVTGSALLRTGQSVPFTATAYSASDTVLHGLTVTWASSAPAVATVDTAGMVRTVAAGTTTISATIGGKAGTAALTVTLWPVTDVVVTPAVDSLLVGDSLALRVVLLDSLGDTLAGRPVAWRTSDTAKATVSASGLVRSRGAGGFAVTAESEGQVGGAFLASQLRAAAVLLPDSVVLSLRHDTVTLVALVVGANGTPLSGRPVVWTAGDTTVARFVAKGRVKAVAVGRTWVAASCCGSVSDTAIIAVRPAGLNRLTLGAPGPWVVGTAGVATAIVTDSLGAQLVLRPQWTVSDAGVLRVVPDSADSTRAVVTPLEPAPAWLVAAVGGLRDSALIDAPLPVRRLVIRPDSLGLVVGQSADVDFAWEDSAGGRRGFAAISHLVITDTSLASLIGGGSYGVLAARPGRTTLVATAVNGTVTYADTMAIVVRPAATWRLFWSATVGEWTAGTTVSAELALMDSVGAVPPAGRDVVLESSDTTVAAVGTARIPSLAGYGRAALRLGRPGTATVVARADSLFAAMVVRTTAFPAARVTFTAPGILAAGDSARLTATAVDAYGNVRPYTVAWSSSDTTVLAVTDSGTIRARGAGRAAVEARTGSVSDTAVVVVPSAAGLSIGAVAPGVVLAGGTATITGSGFATDPSQVRVNVDGVPAVVTAAAPDRLDLRLAASDAYPCALTHDAVLDVASGGAYAATTVRFGAARQVGLVADDSVRVSGAEGVRCTELAPAPNGYVITVANQAPSADAVAAYQLRGTSQGYVVPSPAAVGVAEGAAAGGGGPVTLPRAWSDRSLHRRLLEESRRLAGRAGPPAPLLRARPRVQASVADSVGSLVRFRIPQVDRADFCSSYQGVVTRRAYRGRHLEIYEDTAGPAAGQMDSVYERIGAEFDAVMFPILATNFGDPLALDSLLDHNGRISLVVSPLVEAYAAGFVVTCDFYPESVAPSSNTGETIYVPAARHAGSPPFDGSPDYWLWATRSVLMHEAKHVAAFAQRLLRGAPLEETWLEEGSAVVAEELWARTVYHTTWRGHARYGESLYCDVRPTNLFCAGRPYAMFNAFAFLYVFGQPAATGNEVHTPLGPVSFSDASFYGSAWALLRWAIDQYATDESEFLRALVADPVLTGTANLEARAGRSLSAITADWLLASLNDTRRLPFVLPSTPYGNPSWRYADIFTGMATDFPLDFGAPPIGARAAVTPIFTINVPELRGGTASAVVVSPLSKGQLLELRGPGGAPPPSGLELRILRWQ